MNARLIAILAGCVLLLGFVVTVVRSSRREGNGTGELSGPAAPNTGAPGPGSSTGGADNEEAEAPDDSAAAAVVGLFKGPEASVSAQVAGVIRYLAGPAGTPVRKGELVVELDAPNTGIQSAQAQKGADAARQKWEQAKDARPLKAAEIEGKIKEAEGGVRSAEVMLAKAKEGAEAQADQARNDVSTAKTGVSAAEAQLAKAKAGARPADRAKAEAGLRAARKGLATAEESRDELRDLAARGAVALVRVKEAQARVDQAQAQVEQAEAAVAQVNEGAAPEDIAALEATVEKARVGLKSAEDALRQKKALDAKSVEAAQLQADAARRGLDLARQAKGQLAILDADIKAAYLAWQQAQLAAQQAQLQVRYTRLTSPIDGVVSMVMANRGDVAGPGRPLLSLAGTTGLWLEAPVPARLMEQYRPGRPVIVEVDAFKAKWRGRVREVSTAANPDGRSFTARIEVTDPAARGLRPGMRARAYPPPAPRTAAGDAAATTRP